MQINYDETIKDQLYDYIKTPAVLMDKNEVPYEFRESGSINRLKRRRNNNDIPLELYTFIISNNITKNQLREFASGLFLNYVETSKIYI